MPSRQIVSLITAAAGTALAATLVFPGLPPNGSARTVASPAVSAPDLAHLLGSSSSGGSWSQTIQPGQGSESGSSTSDHNSIAKHCARPVRGWLHTQGMWIKDSRNCKVRLVGVTWYGMQTTYFVPAGLDFRPYRKILSEVKDLGFNSIRIPITDELVRYNKRLRVNNNFLRVNHDLWNLHPLGLLDRIVKAARKVHLMVILDNHFSIARSPASYGRRSPDGTTVHKNEATWTAKGYSEATWIHDWLKLARRYRHNPTVIGFDLRNEPHTNGPGPWSLKTYLEQGATWGPYPDKRWKKKSDWAAAATKCGNRILRVNPHLLMFVEGVQLYPDPTQKRGVETYWWGSILRGVAVDPIRFSVPHQLVYSPHEWGPWKYNLGEFNRHTNYQSITNLFWQNWAFITHLKDSRIRAPIWLGEFNTCDRSPKCVRNKKHGSQGQWFHILMRYLKANPQISWSYYPLNGTNSFDQASNNSILNRNWKHPKQPVLMRAIKRIEGQPRN